MGTVRPCKAATIAFNDGTNTRTFSGVIDASVTLSMDPIETTEMASTWKSYVRGTQGGTASGNIFYDQADDAVLDLESAYKNGTACTFTWTYATGMTHSSSAFITSLGTALAMNDIVKMSFSLQLTGTVTIA
jgi:hypothetical protein